MKAVKALLLALFVSLLTVAPVAIAQDYDENGYPVDVGQQIGSDDGSLDGAGGAGATKNGDGTPLKIDKKTETDLYLLQPLDDSTKTLDAKPGIQIFFDYFNLSWPWVLGVCAGLAVLQAMIGGMQIMLGSDPGPGKERMQWALAGLLIIALSGMILTTINPLFYT